MDSKRLAKALDTIQWVLHEATTWRDRGSHAAFEMSSGGRICLKIWDQSGGDPMTIETGRLIGDYDGCVTWIKEWLDATGMPVTEADNG